MVKQLLFFVFLKKKGDRADVIVTVREEDSKEAIEGAYVKISCEEFEKEDYSNVDGKVEFKELPVRDYTLEVRKMGYSKVVKQIRKEDFYM